MTAMYDRMAELATAAQARICSALAARAGANFESVTWERAPEAGGGGGESRLIRDNPVLEKAGVNVSRVFGVLPEEALRSLLLPASGGPAQFCAVGLSLVIHPRNPFCPTVHANYRYFELGPQLSDTWWFGGGSDLTPAYLFEEDARHFHGVLATACSAHDADYYPRFKRQCDEYFFLPHRGEHRGVGGIFFDRLSDRPVERLFAFVRQCLDAFLPSYLPVFDRRADAPYDEAQKRWQERRRGRYVEFNLLYDRGTSFGLRTGARTESVLMSLPLVARWDEVDPAPGTLEAQLLEVVRTPRAWVP